MSALNVAGKLFLGLRSGSAGAGRCKSHSQSLKLKLRSQFSLSDCFLEVLCDIFTDGNIPIFIY